MSPHDGAGGGVGDRIKEWSEAAHKAASLTLLPLLVDGPYAAVLMRQNRAMMRPAIAAARTLLKAAG
jgi:hypothetical protein